MERADFERMVRLEEGLKQNSQDTRVIKSEVKDIHKRLDSLPEDLAVQLAEHFDTRYASKSLEGVVNQMKETVDPLTTARQRIWIIVISAVIGIGLIIAVSSNALSDIVKKLLT